MSEDEQKTMSGHCVSVTFVGGKNLTSRDLKGGGDPYCVLEAGGKSIKTNVFKGNGKNPVWNRRLDLVGSDQADTISIRVMDWDRASKDDLIGETTINIKDLWKKADPYPPFQWVDIFTTKKGKKKCEGSIQIQIECKKVDDAARLTFFSYTHLLTAIVKQADDLRQMDTLTSNDTFIELSWGARKFRTATKSGKNPSFNEAALIVVDRAELDEGSATMLKVCAYDEDKANKSDFIGEAYIDCERMFEQKTEHNQDPNASDDLGWVSLSPERVTKDVNVAAIASHKNHKSVGRVQVKIVIQSREELENNVMAQIICDFDKSDGQDKGDAVLDRSEVASLVEQCAPDMAENFDAWFRSVDSDKDGVLSTDELKKYMRSTEFVSSKYLQDYIEAHELSKYAGNPDVMRPSTKRGRRRRLFVVHRTSNQMLEENIPGYISVALKAMFSSGVGRVLSRSSTKVMTRLSKRQGRLYNDPKSTSHIPAFVKLHDLNTSDLEKRVDQFKTFNDFFARAIKPAARPIDSPDDPAVCVSPADCRMMVFENILTASNYWVKGKEFTVARLLGDAKLAQHFEGGSFVIARLSPQDYHRWHMPVACTHGKVRPIDGALFTVNPIAINQPVDVYTKNKRCVIDLESKSFGKVAMVAVGATMVGSYIIFGEEGQEWQKGKVHGEFRFGGSTVLLLFEPGKIKFDDDLLRRSSGSKTQAPMETLLQVNSRIGVATGKK